jgi:hypothetical protein
VENTGHGRLRIRAPLQKWRVWASTFGRLNINTGTKSVGALDADRSGTNSQILTPKGTYLGRWGVLVLASQKSQRFATMYQKSQPERRHITYLWKDSCVWRVPIPKPSGPRYATTIPTGETVITTVLRISSDIVYK